MSYGVWPNIFLMSYKVLYKLIHVKNRSILTIFHCSSKVPYNDNSVHIIHTANVPLHIYFVLPLEMALMHTAVVHNLYIPVCHWCLLRLLSHIFTIAQTLLYQFKRRKFSGENSSLVAALFHNK